MSTVLYKTEHHIAHITLNVPEKLNALTSDMKDELTAIFKIIKSDKDVRAVIVSGAGRAFCAGGDVSSMGSKQQNNDGRNRMMFGCDWLKEFVCLEKPVIAAVNGYAFGAGMSLALAADYIMAADNASFQCSFVNIGLVPDMACVWTLPKRVSLGVAKELCYTGRTVKAQEALDIGLADKLVRAEDLMSEAALMAEKLANSATYSIGLMKSLFRNAYSMSFGDFMEVEANYQAAAFHTKDHVMAVDAFLNKTEKNFIGE